MASTMKRRKDTSGRQNGYFRHQATRRSTMGRQNDDNTRHKHRNICS